VARETKIEHAQIIAERVRKILQHRLVVVDALTEGERTAEEVTSSTPCLNATGIDQTDRIFAGIQAR
jgi:hypothetical protein